MIIIRLLSLVVGHKRSLLTNCCYRSFTYTNCGIF